MNSSIENSFIPPTKLSAIFLIIIGRFDALTSLSICVAARRFTGICGPSVVAARLPPGKTGFLVLSPTVAPMLTGLNGIKVSQHQGKVHV